MRLASCVRAATPSRITGEQPLDGLNVEMDSTVFTTCKRKQQLQLDCPNIQTYCPSHSVRFS